jgi:hypothetical protein
VITLNKECAYAEEEKKEELLVPRNELISGTGVFFSSQEGIEQDSTLPETVLWSGRDCRRLHMN